MVAIARAIGVRCERIRPICVRAGLGASLNRITHQKRERVLTLLALGISRREIARREHVGVATIYSADVG
jgi:DNA invertase Pin-like site-specific DNA recombinase